MKDFGCINHGNFYNNSKSHYFKMFQKKINFKIQMFHDLSDKVDK